MSPVAYSLLLAAVACVVRTRTAIYAPLGMRWVQAVIATLAAVYVAGYAVLLAGAEIPLLNGVDRGEWSRAMQNVGCAAWAVLWILEGELLTRAELRTRSEANTALREYSTDADER